MNENEISRIVVDCALYIHRELGPGLLESVYEAVLARQLSKRGLNVKRQVSVPIEFDGEIYEEGFRADLIVNDKLILELKSVESVTAAHKKQLLTYLRLSDIKLGLLLNFGDELMKYGISRIINGRLEA
ncbi:GxxExxY protein [Coraliomargarita parva]|uniref:GxxExxY protein n=1 Tax=Coraliomargarita parva TaxID=3014050 RepID=UPI0022B5428B|nr:GxxExxY protein [Coraliomargarita parva]